MAPNNLVQYNVAKGITEIKLADILSNGYIARKPYEKNITVFTGQILFARLATEYEDCTFHVDVETRDVNYLTYRYDEKHRALPTTYTTFSINAECFEYLEKARISAFDEHQRYYFSFALDNGNEYTGEYLIVKSFEVLDIPNCCKIFKPNDKKGFFCIDEKTLMNLPSALIIKADF